MRNQVQHSKIKQIQSARQLCKQIIYLVDQVKIQLLIKKHNSYSCYKLIKCPSGREYHSVNKIQFSYSELQHRVNQKTQQYLKQSKLRYNAILEKVPQSELDGTFTKMHNQIEKTHLLIFDDFGFKQMTYLSDQFAIAGDITIYKLVDNIPGTSIGWYCDP